MMQTFSKHGPSCVDFVYGTLDSSGGELFQHAGIVVSTEHLQDKKLDEGAQLVNIYCVTN